MDILIDGEIILYGVVGEAWWTDEWFTAADVMKAVSELRDQPRIPVHVNSGGGLVYEGLAICNIFKKAPNFIDLHIDGIAASAMSLICMGADNVTMHAGTSMMIHDISQETYGNPADHEKAAQILHKISDECANAYAQKTNKHDAAQIRQWMQEETWFTPQEALDAGFINQIGDREAMVASLYNYSDYKNAPKVLRAMAEAQANIFIKNEIPPNNLQERTMVMSQVVNEETTSKTGDALPVAVKETAPEANNSAVDEKDIRQQERDRITAITTHEAAAGRSDLAAHFAFKTDMPIEQAIEALQASNKKEAKQAEPEVPTAQTVEPMEAMDGSGMQMPAPKLNANEIYAKRRVAR